MSDIEDGGVENMMVSSPPVRLRRLVSRLLGSPPQGFGLIVTLTILFVLGVGVVAPVLPMFVDELGLSNTEASLLLASFALGRVLWTVPAGPLADRHGFRAITLLSGAVLSLAMGVATISRSPPALLLAQATAGAASAQYTTAAMTTLVDRTPKAAMGRLLGAFQGVIVLVISFAPTVGGLAASVVGISGPFVVSTVGGLLALVLAATLLDEPPPGPGHAEPAPAMHATPQDGHVLGHLLRDRAFVLAFLAGLASTWSMAAIRNTLVPLFADQSLGMSERSIGALLTFGGIAGMAGLVPSGHAMDVLGRRPIVRWGMVATGLTATAFVLVDSVGAVFLVLGAMGLARGVVSPAPAVVVADIAAPRARGAALAVSRVGPAFGLAVGPLAAGALSDTLGLDHAFLVCGLFLSGLALATLAMPETMTGRRGG